MIDPDGLTVVGIGYAGHGWGRNNPRMEKVHGIGPLPAGDYTIGPLEMQHAALGLNVCALMPDPANTMYNRSGFFLHGRKSPTDLDASEGCIVLDHTSRMRVATSADRKLRVIASRSNSIS